MMQLTLASEGHRTAVAASGTAALALVAGNGFQPDLIVSDFASPGRYKRRANSRGAARCTRPACSRRLLDRRHQKREFA
jgi:CheY-like chemotaxis protein